jgi:Anti-sigma-K factor rskA
MNNPRPISAEDLALYAMQALPADEMDTVAAALRDNPQAREELAKLKGDLALLALSSEQHAAPAGSYQRLQARMRESGRNSAVATTPVAAQAAAPVIGMPRRSRWAVWAPWAIAAALAIACSTLGFRYSALNDALDDQVKLSANLAARASHAQQVLEVLNAPNAQRVTLTAGKTPPAPTAYTVYLAERGALVMEASNLEPVPDGKTYELWVLPANGSAPVAAGTFRPNAEGFASVVLPAIAPGITAKGFGVTIEKEEGSTVPTSPIVLSGE